MKHRTYLKYLFAVLPVVTILRIAQMLFTINPEDGFNFSEYSALTSVCNGALAVLCVVFFAAGFFLKRPFGLEHEIKGIPMAAATFLMSLGVIVQAVSRVISLSGKLTGVSAAAVILDVIMGILFFIMACNCLSGRKISGAVPVSALVWSVAEMILYYTGFNGVTMNSENIFNLMAMCTAMLFWLYFAHICTGYHAEGSSRYAFVFGSIACIFCVLCTVVRIVIYAAGRGEVLNTASTVDAVNVSTAVFIITFLCTMVPSVETAIKLRARRSAEARLARSGASPAEAPTTDTDIHPEFTENDSASRAEDAEAAVNAAPELPRDRGNEATVNEENITGKEQ